MAFTDFTGLTVLLEKVVILFRVCSPSQRTAEQEKNNMAKFRFHEELLVLRFALLGLSLLSLAVLPPHTGTT